MWCRNCGTELAEGSVFCHNCGTSQQSSNNVYSTSQQYAGDATMVTRNTVGRKEEYTFVEAVKSLFSNYFNFSGRATKSEYWWAFLFICVVEIISSAIPYVGSLVALVLLIPNISLNIRRLHDTGKSGLYLLMSLIPLVGVILLIVQYCKDSVSDNQWGPGPSQW